MGSSKHVNVNTIALIQMIQAFGGDRVRFSPNSTPKRDVKFLAWR